MRLHYGKKQGSFAFALSAFWCPLIFCQFKNKDIPLGNKLRNSHRDLLPNIDTAYFCNIGMEKPHKHWVYAASVGGEDGIRTHVRLLAN